jgi:hypothetical protein
MRLRTLTIIFFVTIAVLISTSFVVASYSRINDEEHVCDISEESGDNSDECSDAHNMMNEMDEHHESMHSEHHNTAAHNDHHEESRHGCH